MHLFYASKTFQQVFSKHTYRRYVITVAVAIGMKVETINFNAICKLPFVVVFVVKSFERFFAHFARLENSYKPLNRSEEDQIIGRFCGQYFALSVYITHKLSSSIHFVTIFEIENAWGRI